MKDNKYRGCKHSHTFIEALRKCNLWKQPYCNTLLEQQIDGHFYSTYLSMWKTIYSMLAILHFSSDSHDVAMVFATHSVNFHASSEIANTGLRAYKNKECVCAHPYMLHLCNTFLLIHHCKEEEIHSIHTYQSILLQRLYVGSRWCSVVHFA